MHIYICAETLSELDSGLSYAVLGMKPTAELASCYCG